MHLLLLLPASYCLHMVPSSDGPCRELQHALVEAVAEAVCSGNVDVCRYLTANLRCSLESMYSSVGTFVSATPDGFLMQEGLLEIACDMNGLPCDGRLPFAPDC